MDAGVSLTYPFSLEPMGWRSAMDVFGTLRGFNSSWERIAVDKFVHKYSLFKDDSMGAVRKAVNLFRARVLLRMAQGLQTDDIVSEYQIIQLTLFRHSGYDKTVRLCLDEILPSEVDEVVATAKELVALGKEKPKRS